MPKIPLKRFRLLSFLREGCLDFKIVLGYRSLHNTNVPVLLYLKVQYVCMYSHQSSGQPGKVAKLARGQLNRENGYFSVGVRSRLRIWPCETGLALPSCISLFILHARVESGAYLRDSFRFPRRHFIYLYRHMPYIGLIRSLSGRATCVLMTFTAESPSAQGQ